VSYELKITPRETEVAKLLAEGKRYQEVADDLGIAYETVVTHVKRLRLKLGVRTKTEVALWYQKSGGDT